MGDCARWMGDCATWMGDCATWMGDCYVLGFAPSSLKSSLKSKLMCRLYTRSLEGVYEPKSPGCAHMQKDHISAHSRACTPCQEFSGLWKLTHTYTHTWHTLQKTCETARKGHIRTLTILSLCQSSMDYGNAKQPGMHAKNVRVCSQAEKSTA